MDPKDLRECTLMLESLKPNFHSTINDTVALRFDRTCAKLIQIYLSLSILVCAYILII